CQQHSNWPQPTF
nr:immunoglobulin light chain junction region [Macaca mulatta]MPN98743.1 immunoglobulin light chain junction region [Macaca mulatta]MPO00694.1 immunoglobulin light chain junction region [Macaca mulatta]